LVIHLVLRRDDHDGDMLLPGVGADLFDDLNTIHIRQHQVQQHQVRLVVV